MTDPFMGEIIMVAFNFAPDGYALCEGQELEIGQNPTLYTLIGTTYGGDDIRNFNLPDFRGRVPMHRSTTHIIGQAGGIAQTTLIADNIPQHAHPFTGNVPMNLTAGVEANGTFPSGTSPAPAPSGAPRYSSQADEKMTVIDASELSSGVPFTTASTGTAAPFNNMMPYLPIRFIIALVGIFPSRA